MRRFQHTGPADFLCRSLLQINAGVKKLVPVKKISIPARWKARAFMIFGSGGAPPGQFAVAQSEGCDLPAERRSSSILTQNLDQFFGAGHLG